MKASIQVVTLWGKQAPAHSITAILITEDQRTIVTGSQEGPLCLWDLSPELKISSKQLLLGHTASVTCLAKARDFEKQPYVVSATENGEMCIWNVTCGQCIEHTRLPFRHTAICYYHSSFRMTGDGWLLCCGQYNDILLIDAKTLAVLHTLSSSQSSDWISCMCLIHSPRIQEDSLIAVSAAGDLKVWDLSSSVSRIQEKQRVADRESKALGCASCHTIRFCPYTERLLLIVFPSCWKVYDYCDFSLLWTEASPKSQSWAGGDVLAAYRLVIWTETGQGYIYQLLNSGLSRSKQPSDGRALKETVYPILLCSMAVGDNKSFSYVMGFMNERKEPFYKILYSGDASGRITLWHIPDVPVSTLDGSPKEIPIAASWTLRDHFEAHGSVAEDILDRLTGAGQGVRRAVSSSVYIPSLDKLVCGCEDGRIFIVSALQAVKTRLLEDNSVLKDALPHGILAGHSSSVTSLLYLRGWSTRFDPSWLVSGSQDSCVIWWDMFTGEMLHQFSLQAGPVTNLLLSSENYRFRGQRIVCCLCSDHSVALLHLQERACVLHARRHLFPVRRLRWHPSENLLVVGCENDSVSVWDVETGILERHETGEMAKAVLAGGEDCLLSPEDSLLPVFEDDTHKQKNAAGPSCSSCKLDLPSYSSFTHQGKTSRRLPAICHAQWPFTILPLKTKWENGTFHVLLFDLERLAELLRAPSPRSALKASNSLHSFNALERAKSATEKGALLLKRNKTAGALSPLEGPGPERRFGDGPAEQSRALKRPKKSSKRPKKTRHQPLGTVHLDGVTDVTKLLLACLLPWGVDRETDNLCVQYLGITRLHMPVSFGLVSKKTHLSLTLPGWSHAGSALWDLRSPPVNVRSSKLLDLRNKYLHVVQEPAGKPNGHTKTPGAPEGLPTLISLLKRMCLVKKIVSMPLEKSSPQKVELVRSKWRATQPVGSTRFYEESSESSSGFPVHDPENVSLVKLLFCWRDQSIEVTEAMQAALLAEVQRSMRGLQTTLANGHGLLPASLATVSKEDAKAERPEVLRSHSLLAATPVVKCDSSSSPENFLGGENISERNILEEMDNQEEKKPLPWMSKVCSCKVC